MEVGGRSRRRSGHGSISSRDDVDIRMSANSTCSAHNHRRALVLLLFILEVATTAHAFRSLVLPSGKSIRGSKTAYEHRAAAVLLLAGDSSSADDGDDDDAGQESGSDLYKYQYRDERSDPFRASEGIFGSKVFSSPEPTTPTTQSVPVPVSTLLSSSTSSPSSYPRSFTSVSSSVSSDNDDNEDQELIRPLGGGSNMIFEMAQKYILAWGPPEGKDGKASTSASKDSPPQKRPSRPTNITSAAPGPKQARMMEQAQTLTATTRVLPRWHPHQGVSNANPNFRTQAPAMNNQGYAKSMWRNVRKRNKPSLWRQTLRTYDRMTQLERQQNRQRKQQQQTMQDQHNEPKLLIQRSNTHHEAAMLACAKLGDWRRALQIYQTVYKIERLQLQQRQQQYQQLASLNPTTRASAPKMTKKISITESMMDSLVYACARASRMKKADIAVVNSSSNSNLTHTSSNSQSNSTIINQSISQGNSQGISQGKNNTTDSELPPYSRRQPLDIMVAVLRHMERRHSIPVIARHVNPIASAYIDMGCSKEGTYILQNLLTNRTAGDEPENGMDIFNIYDVCAKNKGSYGLLVSSAVSSGEWGDAVEALAEMTEAGLFPNSRHCNAWYEISERHSRPRAVRSWKKKRDHNWVESL